jgi:hypothetical protein
MMELDDVIAAKLEDRQAAESGADDAVNNLLIGGVSARLPLRFNVGQVPLGCLAHRERAAAGVDLAQRVFPIGHLAAHPEGAITCVVERDVADAAQAGPAHPAGLRPVLEDERLGSGWGDVLPTLSSVSV